ncbi:hypothetical protein LCGC14_0376780 [marine sediment metagenome]|uniref:Uncharacterized protein n=1 Tax=marine sediment metagenome TaxID=412755 RepID=A0A0F9TLN4_9ZZZZ
MDLKPLLVPAGSDTEVQLNDGGIFGADATFNFNKTTKTLTAQELEVTNDANVGATCTVKRLLAGGVTE